MQFDFEWDPDKAKKNAMKHGVSFELAMTAFDDPFGLVADDLEHSTHEERQWLIGKSDKGLLVVVFTIRQSGKIRRLIHARWANRLERRIYEENKRISF